MSDRPEGPDSPLPASETKTILGLPPGATAVSRSEFSLMPEDLLNDKILATAPRQIFQGRSVPALGGIPLIAKIGQGGMGAVYLGFKRLLELEVAVKVLPLHLVASQPELAEQFIREARIAANIQSPHMVGVSDVSQENELFFIVMEYVRGVSAGKYLKQCQDAGQTGVAEAAALDICIAAAEGLAAAHGEDIIHRDVKPDNILIPRAKGSESLVLTASKLSDLGLAHGKDSGHSVLGAHIVGTPGFMSPEQWESAGCAGKPADVFSLGATLYALLTGKAPFCGSFSQLMRATMEAPHTPVQQARSDVSSATVALVDRCLSKRAAERYEDGFALLEALKSCRKLLGDTIVQRGAPVRSAADTVFASLNITFADRFHSAKMLNGILDRRHGTTASYLVLPNAWILLNVGTHLEEAYHLVAWDGKPELHLKSDGPALLKANGSAGPWSVLGIDARSAEGMQTLKWASTAQRIPSIVAGDLMDPRQMSQLESARPESLRIEGHAPLFVLAKLQDLKYLSVVNKVMLSNLEPLNKLNALSGLNLDGLRGLTSTRGLAQLSKLSHLRLGNCSQLADLAGIDALADLRYLCVNMCVKAMVQGTLSALKNLTQLQINGAFALTDLRGIESMKKLRILDLGSCYALRDISLLAELQNLRVLNLRRCDLVNDLRPVLWLKELISLGLPPGITGADLHAMRDAGVFDNVRLLDLGGCTELSSLDALKNLKHLSRLSLAGCVGLAAREIDSFARAIPECTILQ